LHSAPVGPFSDTHFWVLFSCFLRVLFTPHETFPRAFHTQVFIWTKSICQVLCVASIRVSGLISDGWCSFFAAFYRSFVAEDAPEISHAEVVWNAAHDIMQVGGTLMATRRLACDSMLCDVVML
jgi:hypothetical protein